MGRQEGSCSKYSGYDGAKKDFSVSHRMTKSLIERIKIVNAVKIFRLKMRTTRSPKKTLLRRRKLLLLS